MTELWAVNGEAEDGAEQERCDAVRAMSEHGDLMERVEAMRVAASRRIERSGRDTFGQFLTPAPVAQLMASLPEATDAQVSILDAGAGAGSLLAAVAQLCGRPECPEEIHVTAYEIDPLLVPYLRDQKGDILTARRIVCRCALP